MPTEPNDRSRDDAITGHMIVSELKYVVACRREHSIRHEIQMQVAPASSFKCGQVPGRRKCELSSAARFMAFQGRIKNSNRLKAG